MSTAEFDHSRLSKPIHDERFVKIICIGAGVCGLILAYKLRRSFENFELVIYEKNEGVGGTWFENTYPGLTCDVPSHSYTYSFEPKADWSAMYSSGKEIFDYLNSFAEKYDLKKHIKFNHKIIGAGWNDNDGRWNVEVERLDDGSTVQDTCHILVNASGVFNTWRWPDIPGLRTFKGPIVHTANWDHTVDFTNKHIAVIGNGSSGVQILPALAPQASKITHFIRSPTWIAPLFGAKQRLYTQEEIDNFKKDPKAHLNYRKDVGRDLTKLLSVYFADSPEQKAAVESMTGIIKEKFPDETLHEFLIPKWGVGCRRISPGINYLETLASDKVTIVTGPIKGITELGCVSEKDNEHPVDIIVCATGFDTSYKPRFPIIGLKGQRLDQVWKDEPNGYFGMAVAGFPNYFTMLGPGTPVNSGPTVVPFEAQADYILKLVDRWQTENIHSMSPKEEAVQELAAYRDNFMQGTVWVQNCRSWYKSNTVSGKVAAIWPGSALQYLEAIVEPRYEDFDFRYKENRFSFLGNGFSQVEKDPMADPLYSIRNEDDSPHLSRSKRRKAATRANLEATSA